MAKWKRQGKRRRCVNCRDYLDDVEMDLCNDCIEELLSDVEDVPREYDEEMENDEDD
jgi:predicted amidophosphoribosyltransferase